MRAHLLLLLAAVLLPVIAFAGFSVLQFAEAESSRIEARAVEVAREAESALEREFSEIVTAARVLAASEALASGALEQFHRRAVEVAQQLDGAVALRDPESRQVLNSSVPWGAQLPSGSRLREVDARAAATGQPVFSDYFVGLADPRPWYAIVLPLPPGASDIRFLTVAVPVARIQRILEREVSLLPGMVAGVIDRNGVWIARTRNPALLIGQRAQVGPADEGGRTQAYGRNAEGEPALLTYRISAMSGWRVGASVSLATLHAPYWAAMANLAVLGLGALGLALLAALLLGRRLTGAVGALSRLGGALERNEPVPRLSTPLREANEVAEVLAAAARERESQEQVLRETEARERLAREAGGIGIFDFDPMSGLAVWDARVRAIWGFESEEPVTRTLFMRGVHPDDRPHAAAALARALDPSGDGEYRAEYRVVNARDGATRHVSVTGRASFEGGRAVRVVGTVLDVTAAHEAVERQMLLAHEVDHRARNLLTVVRALLRLTEADDREAYVAVLEGRIAALARAHGLLSRDRWSGAALRELAGDELAPYAGPARVRLDGPPLRLRPDAVQPLSMVLHELATNAAKYGALAAPDGRLTLGWSRGADGVLRLVWQERGGRRLTEAPGRSGFGTQLVEATLRQQLGGDIVWEWLPEGLRCTMTVAADLVAGPAPAAVTPAEAPASVPSPKAGPARRRVLVAEDEALIALDLVRLLAGAGWQVAGPVGSVDEAEALAATDGALDAALLDVNLRGRGSGQAAALLAARGIPVVFLTGYGRAPAGWEGRATVLAKPVNPAAVLDALEAAARRREPAGAG